MASQPLKWHGGKNPMAKRIIALLPPHVHYVEPYFGGGAVLFAKPREWVEKHSEVVNDINVELVNFWTVLSQPKLFELFRRRVEAVPFCQSHWSASKLAEHAGYEGDGTPEENRAAAALTFFIRYRQSRQGLGKDFATLSRTRTRRGMNEQASAWLSAVEGLPEAHERLRRVVILCDEALKVIRREDGADTLFYCDPPYLHDTRVTRDDYAHEMTRKDHEALLIQLSEIRGKFILSGYRDPLYAAAETINQWHRVDVPIDCKASGARSKPQRVECLWTNYEVKR